MDMIKNFQVVIKYISNIYIPNCKKIQGFMNERSFSKELSYND